MGGSVNMPNELNKARVSVLILAYNHENYIRQSLDGALNQQTNFSYDIWVHDDASTDGTQAILKEYQARYPDKIKLVLQETNVFQRGIKPLTTFIYPKLTSDYVAYCEGDDYWVDPTKLQKQVDFLDAHPDYSLCAHDVEVVFEEGVPTKEEFYQKPKTGNFTFEFWEEFKQHFVATPTLMARREIIQALPVNNNNVSGDIFGILFLLSRGKGYYMEEKFVVKRRNLGGITFNKSYLKTVVNGKRLLWKEVLKFAPHNCKPLVALKLAEYERNMVKEERPKSPIKLVQLILNAVRHDPYWLIGKSSKRSKRLWRAVQS